VVRDADGHRFGAFVNEAFRVSEKSFGSGECFVFRISDDGGGVQVMGRGAEQDCQIFLGTTYQNGKNISQMTMKYTTLPQNILNSLKIDQIAIK
jgi:hypothetical protein